MQKQQDDQHHQNNSAKAHARMTHAIAIAAKTAAQAAHQVDDHKNDQDQPKGHGAPPCKRTANEIRRPAWSKAHRAFDSSLGTPVAYFGSSFSAAELMQ